jgi:serine/threonine protein kinase
MHRLSAEEPQGIGRYRLLGRLGQGGMGTVYLGEDDSGQKVAVKVINSALAQEEKFRQRFCREAEAAQRVRRFCTAPVIETALDGDRLYTVTEYVDGPTLYEAVRSGGPLSGSSLDALAVGVATALTAIHDAGIVHRDLKPSNVLLSPIGPRVIDFGIARALDAVDGVTKSGEVVGSPQYIAPEVLRGEAVTPACDVFSWGCLVTFAGTGCTPFDARTTPGVIYQIMQEEPRLDDLDPALRNLVARTLDKDPAMRPSARQLLDQLIGGEETPLEHAAQNVTTGWRRTSPQNADLSSSPDNELIKQVGELSTARPIGRLTEPPTGPPVKRGILKRKRLIPVAIALAALIMSATIILVFRPGSEGPDATSVSGTPLFSDDFVERQGWDGWDFNPAGGSQRGYEITRGVYTMQAGQNYPSNMSMSPIPEKAAATPVRDAVIGVTAVVREGASGQGEFGLLCRYDEDIPNGYLFVLRTDGRARLIKNARGNYRTLGQPVLFDAPRQGEPVKVQAACSGTRLTMWINGEKVIETTDAAGFEGGTASQVGLVVRTPESVSGVIKVEFDDFAVHKGA